MKRVKYRWPLYAFYDRTGIENYLEQQAAKGWLLEDITGFGWKFRRVQPTKMHFAVTYLPKQPVPDWEDNIRDREILEFCECAGWKIAAADDYRRIFRTEREDPVPIETDPVLELENIHRQTMAGFVKGHGTMLLLIVLQSVKFFSKLSHDPFSVLADQTLLTLLMAFILGFLISVAEIIRYFCWHRKAKKTAEALGYLPETGSRWKVLVRLLEGIAALTVLTLDMNYLIVALVLGGLVFALMGVAVNIGEWIKRTFYYSKGTIKFWRMACAIAALVLAICIGSGAVVWMERQGWVDTSSDSVNNSILGCLMGWEDMEQPINAAELILEEDRIGTASWQGSESLLLAQYYLDQQVSRGEVSVTFIKVKVPALYPLFLDEMVNFYDLYTFAPVDPTAWNADRAYRLSLEEYKKAEIYLLCYGDMLVRYASDIPITEEQMALVGEVLGK